jgi:hypothetical protein
MHKNKFVVLDALYIATVLRRALIEPTVQHSRLGEENRTKRLYLRAYWDLEPLCRRFDIVPYALYARYYAPKGERGQRRPHHRREKAIVTPRAANDGIGRFRLRSERAVRQAFGALRAVGLIELRGWWRSVTNREADGRSLRYQGHPMRSSWWELNPGYERVAVSLIDATLPPAARGRYLAVQWRTEDWHVPYGRGRHANASAAPKLNHTAAAALLECAGWAAERVLATMAQQRLTEVVLATDLRRGSSGTYGHSEAQEAALAALEAAVPALRATRRRWLLDAIPDTGVRASVEAAICTQATMVLTTTSACRDCGRAARCSKMSSAFGKYILRRRTAYHRPAEPLF